MDLVQWLTAQLDEDERIARAATSGPWSVNDESYAEWIIAADGTEVVAGGRWGGEASVFESTEDALHIAEHDPARELREIDAKRRLLDEHQDVNGGSCGTCVDGQWGYPTHGGSSPQRFPCRTLRLLGLPYADRPGFQESWRP